MIDWLFPVNHVSADWNSLKLATDIQTAAGVRVTLSKILLRRLQWGRGNWGYATYRRRPTTFHENSSTATNSSINPHGEWMLSHFNLSRSCTLLSTLSLLNIFAIRIPQCMTKSRFVSSEQHPSPTFKLVSGVLILLCRNLVGLLKLLKS